MPEKNGKVGIYMRLSRDDEKSGESSSIEHQRIILQKFVAEHGGTVIDEYADDGWSGTNFDRPAVRRMLEDAKFGKIDTIIVKDLSRFGRNYIQVGQYVDYIFPAYGVRFIAISDNVDTAERGSAAMDMMPIMNVFNEWHSANTSKKIRAVLDASRRSGKYVGSVYPYGYKAGTDEARTAVIDVRAAEVVRRIFNLRAQGNSARAIARILTDEGIPNPATYFTKLDGNKINGQFSAFWCASTVTGILSNPTYLGATVQHKTTSISYKNHRVINIPEDERIVRENAHEAIISRDLWEKAQAVNKSLSRGKADKRKTVHALSGLIICADCGKKLKFKSSKGGNSGCFVCRTYVDLGKSYCTSHAISEKLIEGAVLRDIRAMLGVVEIDEDKARESFINRTAKRGESNRLSDEKRLKNLKNRLAELDRLIQSAFEERVLRNMPEGVCASLCEKYLKEKTAAKEEVSETEKRLAEVCTDSDAAEEYVQRLRAYCNCESLTRELCLQLINFITVSEKSASDGSRVIHIYYNACFSHT